MRAILASRTSSPGASRPPPGRRPARPSSRPRCSCRPRADHQVGPHHRALQPGVRHADLLVEVAPGAHPGQLDHPAQLHLAPAAARFRPAQRGDQRLGLRPGAARRSAIAELHLLGQRGLRVCLAVSVSRSCASTLARVSLSGSTSCSTALRLESSSPGRAEVRRAQPDLADLHQPLLAGVQRLRRQRLEPLGQVAVDQVGALLGRLVARATRSVAALARSCAAPAAGREFRRRAGQPDRAYRKPITTPRPHPQAGR